MFKKFCSLFELVGHLTVGIEGLVPIFPYEQTFFALSTKVWNEILSALVLSICKYSKDHLAWSDRPVNLSAATRAASMNMIRKCSKSSAVYLNR